jgi:hypothetical protein
VPTYRSINQSRSWDILGAMFWTGAPGASPNPTGKRKEQVDTNSHPPAPKRDIKEKHANSTAGKLAAHHQQGSWTNMDTDSSQMSYFPSCRTVWETCRIPNVYAVETLFLRSDAKRVEQVRNLQRVPFLLRKTQGLRIPAQIPHKKRVVPKVGK